LPIGISAITRGEDQIKRVVTSQLRVLPFEGLELTAGPIEVKGARAEYWLEVHNTGNTPAQVDVRIDTHPDKIRAEPAHHQFRLLNGHTRRVPFVVRTGRPRFVL